MLLPKIKYNMVKYDKSTFSVQVLFSILYHTFTTSMLEVTTILCYRNVMTDDYYYYWYYAVFLCTLHLFRK